MEDLVGISVADSAEEMRISQRAFESVIFKSERLRECFKGAIQDFEAARIKHLQRLFTLNQMQRSALFRAGFSQEQRPVWKFKRGARILRGQFHRCFTPMQPAG